MRKIFIAPVLVLTMGMTAPAFSQGLQTPSAPNATPPAGTVPNMGSSKVTRPGAQLHRHIVRRRAATSEKLGQ